MNVYTWSAEHRAAAKSILADCDTVDEALAKIADVTGRHVSSSALRHAFQSAGLGAPSTHLRRDDAPPAAKVDDAPAVRDTFIIPPPVSDVAQPTGSISAIHEERRRQVESETPEHAPDLVRLLRVRPLPLFDVCEKFDIKPSELADLVKRSNVAGYHLAINDGWISAPKGPIESAPHDFGGHSPGPKRHLIVSDLHIGSEYSAVDELSRFIEWGYQEGARVVHIPGDILDGCDSRLIYEQDRVGFQRQAEHCIRHMPELPGLRYYTCSGNHDCHTKDSTGVDPGRALENEFRIAGRKDWTHVGAYRVRYKVDGASFLLYHPNGGASRKHNVIAHCYGAIDREPTPPDFFLSGHLHKNIIDYCYKGTFSCACPTWQRPGSPFANRLSGEWEVGGLVLDYIVREDGVIDGKGARMFKADAFTKAKSAA